MDLGALFCGWQSAGSGEQGEEGAARWLPAR